MAILKISFNKTLAFEGLYSNDKDDRGEETYKGIAYASNKDWAGWAIIHKYYGNAKFPACLENDAQLQILVEQRYRHNYWNPIKGDELVKQQMADYLFDTAVNNGVVTAIKMHQAALGLPQTGVMDALTLTTSNKVK